MIVGNDTETVQLRFTPPLAGKLMDDVGRITSLLEPALEPADWAGISLWMVVGKAALDDQGDRIFQEQAWFALIHIPGGMDIYQGRAGSAQAVLDLRWIRGPPNH